MTRWIFFYNLVNFSPCKYLSTPVETSVIEGIQVGAYIIGVGYALLIIVYILYIRGIRSGEIPPANPASWFIFSAISFGNAFVLWGEISPIMRVFPFIMGMAQLLIARMSSQKRDGFLELFDKLALGIGVIAVIFWVTASMNIIVMGRYFPIAMMLVADLVGFYPTVRDAWQKPAKEDIPVWGVFSIVGVIVLLGLWLERKNGIDLVYPVYETALAVSTLATLFIRTSWWKPRSTGWENSKKGSYASLFLIKFFTIYPLISLGSEFHSCLFDHTRIATEVPLCLGSCNDIIDTYSSKFITR